MLEEIRRVGQVKAPEIYKEVAPVNPYPKIDPQQQRQDGYTRSQQERKPEQNQRVRRRFTAMRELIDQLKLQARITRVDYNTANGELIDLGLSIAEEELLSQLLALKIPLAGIEDLIKQIQQRSSSPLLVGGRNIPSGSKLFPLHVEELAEYVMRFDDLQVTVGPQGAGILNEINSSNHFTTEHNRLRLYFSRISTMPAVADEPLSLAISIQLGAVEVDETGRRAILYQRPDQSYGLYSDKSINLSI